MGASLAKLEEGRTVTSSDSKNSSQGMLCEQLRDTPDVYTTCIYTQINRI